MATTLTSDWFAPPVVAPSRNRRTVAVVLTLLAVLVIVVAGSVSAYEYTTLENQCYSQATTYVDKIVFESVDVLADSGATVRLSGLTMGRTMHDGPMSATVPIAVTLTVDAGIFTRDMSVATVCKGSFRGMGWETEYSKV